ncbi:putative RNA-directed DNA polymerase, eukaryota, reverse transcriptase zinc-binding domain protein [Tanacetum coccineum]|uniref:RNA-directed DNA polymerase, eukaryota, reverse transcriptase zinc-binding domain protein n=1 Tax=Tanacetum coccineum TaxID=301880 RepID=A0ABQ5G1M9_9ASTR
MYLKVLRLVQIQWTSPFFNLRTMLSLWVNGLSTMKKNLYRILRCFHMASDLKANFAKSKFFGVGVSNTDTNTFASIHCCEPSSFPCSYLGLPIGANMNKSGNWNAIIEKFQKRLTSWKANNLSIGGHLTLIKLVLGSLGTYFFFLLKASRVVIKYLEKLRCNFFWGGDKESNKMAWISWKKICSPSTCGGLGVIEQVAVRSGMDSKMAELPSNLKSLYPRLFALETNKECHISDLCFTQNGLPHHIWAWRRVVRDGHEMNQLRDLLGLVNSFCPCDTPNSWAFTLNTHKYIIVASMCREIEKHILCDQPSITRWNKSMPTKINVHIWRLYLNHLLTRCNLDSRSIDLHSSRCPVRDGDIETAQHLFIDCLIVSGLWHMVIKWWHLENHPQDLHSLLSWSDTVNFMDTTKTCFDVVVHTTTWIIWRYRNHVCFNSKPPWKDTLEDDVKIFSHA